jgi:hypothetical protein
MRVRVHPDSLGAHVVSSIKQSQQMLVPVDLNTCLDVKTMKFDVILLGHKIVCSLFLLPFQIGVQSIRASSHRTMPDQGGASYNNNLRIQHNVHSYALHCIGETGRFHFWG